MFSVNCDVDGTFSFVSNEVVDCVHMFTGGISPLWVSSIKVWPIQWKNNKH